MGSTTDSSGNCVLDGVFLFGEFPILDLSRVTVINSRFSGYSNLPRCRFENTKFLFTTFEGCGGPQSAHESIGSAYFDSSCKLGDLSETLRLAKDDKATEAATVEADVERFLHCFFKGSRFIDCKTLYMKFSNRAPGLTLETFDRLIHADYISVKVEKADETYYKISDRFAPSVYRFLMNAYIDGRMRAFIAFVK